jgi:hypothetical protein
MRRWLNKLVNKDAPATARRHAARRSGFSNTNT